MANFATVSNGVITNVMVAESEVVQQFEMNNVMGEDVTFHDLTDLDPQPGIGWQYQDGTWTAPEGQQAPEPPDGADSPAEAPTDPQGDATQDDDIPAGEVWVDTPDEKEA